MVYQHFYSRVVYGALIVGFEGSIAFSGSF